MLTLGGASGDDEKSLWGRLWRFDALLQLGQVDAAEAEIAPMSALAGQLRRPIARWHALRSRAAIAFARGRFDEATDLTNECLALSQRAQHGGGILGGELMIILIGAQTGAELPPGLSKPDGWQANARNAGPLATWHVSAGDLSTAPRLYSGYLAAEQVPAFILLPMLAGKAELAAALDDRAGARDAYGRLVPYADLFVCAGAGVLYVGGSVQTCLGAAAATVGRLDDGPYGIYEPA